MADPRNPVGDDFQALAVELMNIKRRLDTLETPTGTSTFQTVAKLQKLVEDIQAQLDEYNRNRYTNAQIDSLVATRLTQDQVDTRIQIALASYFSGNVSIGGELVVNGAVRLPGARGTSVATASGRVAAWLAGDGRLGNTA